MVHSKGSIPLVASSNIAKYNIININKVMNTLFIWAAAHPMTAEQKEDLEAQGVVVLLETVDNHLWKTMCNISVDEATNTYMSSIVKVLKYTVINCLIKYDNVVLVQPAGSPAFHCVLGNKWNDHSAIWYAISERNSKDEAQPDGSIKKVSYFKHMGWTKL